MVEPELNVPELADLGLGLEPGQSQQIWSSNCCKWGTEAGEAELDVTLLKKNI